MFKEYVLTNDVFELTIVPRFGCHWTTLRLSSEGRWLDLLLPVPDQATLTRRPSHYGNYLLAPWSNRISRGVFKYDNRTYQLRRNSSDRTAIHGDVRMRAWKVLKGTVDAFEAELDTGYFEDFNFPFPLHFHHSVQISGNTLKTGIWVRNTGTERAPVGLGFHPYFLRRLMADDPDVELTVPAEKVYPALGRIPTGPAVPVTGKLDLRPRALLGKRNLDHCYTGLKSAPVKIFYPGTGFEVTMRMEPLYSHVVVYAPDTWWGCGPPRSFFCIEPVTHANDGFNLLAKGWEDTGVKQLEPGESWGGSFELAVNKIL